MRVEERRSQRFHPTFNKGPTHDERMSVSFLVFSKEDQFTISSLFKDFTNKSIVRYVFGLNVNNGIIMQIGGDDDDDDE